MVDIISMMWNEYKNLSLLRVLMKIESLFGKYEDFDDDVYRPENFAILKYCYDNYKFNYDIDVFIVKSPLSKKRLIFCRSLWKKELMKLWAHWMKKMMRRAKNKRRKSGLATRAHLLMRVTFQLIHCLIPLRAYRRMIAMMIVMIPLILLKYPFLMMLAMLVAKMPI